MDVQKWLDELSKLAAGSLARRELARPLAALLPALLGASPTAGKSGRGGKRRANSRDQGKISRQTKLVSAAGGDECNANWSGSSTRARRNRRHCRFIRRQCDGDDPREFCIVDGLFGNPPRLTKAAVCCNQGEVCCGNGCCDVADGTRACCDGFCISLDDRESCGSCDNPCLEDEVCENRTCVLKPPICALGARAGDDGDCSSACGRGGTPCPGAYRNCCAAGKTCCNGRCIDTQSDNNNCGGCGVRCRKTWSPGHEVCVNGACVCQIAGATWDDACNGCMTPNYFCCDAIGNHCPKTHECVAVAPNPDGSANFGCIGKSP